jgi:glutamine synthetase
LVAPNQFEIAPIFEESTNAVEHNLLLMETLHQVAHRHKLKVLFHEKPFKGVNGSGKHCNWSMSTDQGDNLLEPTNSPETNYRFLLFLVATLDAVNNHGALLRASIASASNEHRLGAQEAPPSIVSAFLGQHLSEVLDSIEEKRTMKDLTPKLTTVKVGGTVLDVQVATLPHISRDLTDRNRTSPFAFTGNKFEFRAVGSKQSPSFPIVLLNSAVAQSLINITADLQKQKGKKDKPSNEDILVVVREYIKRSKSIRFEGNGYSEEWIKEAERRGLPIIRKCPDAFKVLLNPKHSDLLIGLGVMTETEIHSRYHILCEKYAKEILIEANTLKVMTVQAILPSVFAYRKALSESLVSQKTLGLDVSKSPELQSLEETTELATSLQSASQELSENIEKMNKTEEEHQAEFASNVLVGNIALARGICDKLEQIIPDEYWPYPKYLELLF